MLFGVAKREIPTPPRPQVYVALVSPRIVGSCTMRTDRDITNQDVRLQRTLSPTASQFYIDNIFRDVQSIITDDGVGPVTEVVL